MLMLMQFYRLRKGKHRVFRDGLGGAFSPGFKEALLLPSPPVLQALSIDKASNFHIWLPDIQCWLWYPCPQHLEASLFILIYILLFSREAGSGMACVKLSVLTVGQALWSYFPCRRGIFCFPQHHSQVIIILIQSCASYCASSLQ